MKRSLRLRATGHSSEDGPVLPTTNQPATHRRRRQRRPYTSSIRSDSGALVAIFVVIFLIIIAGYKYLSGNSPDEEYFLPDPSVPLAPRFPSFGNHDFQKRCPWIISSSNVQSEGTIYVTMIPRNNEGLAEWVSGIGTGLLLAELLHSRIFIDYGFNVDVHAIMEPVREDRNWTLTSNFSCQEDSNCRKVYGIQPEGNSRSFQHQPLPKVPVYRHGSKGIDKYGLLENDFDPLRQIVPGYRLADGFACAFQSLVRLSPRATHYQPDLFSKLLPALSDPSALVLSLYIRTGYTDKIVKAEEAGLDWPEPNLNARTPPNGVIDCALELERLGTGGGKIVWMVISDSLAVKEAMVSTYTTEKRQVLTTNARGKHTKPLSNPNTKDFAEAFLDWYLIGESNAVITSNPWYSYGFMGAIRTSRPIYSGVKHNGTSCRREEWAH